MKKKLLTILLSIFMMLGTFVNVVYAQSYNITITCDSDQGYFSKSSDEDDGQVNNPSVVQVEKDSLCYYREGTDGTASARRLFIYDSYPFGTMLFFAFANPKEGYDFDGWYIGDTKIGTGTTAANPNDNVVAKFVSYTKKVSGTVLDEDSNPVAGAEVKFESNDLYKYYTTTTDSDGKWSIDAKKNGTYTLKIKKSGFAQFEENNIAFGDTDTNLGSRQLTKLNLTYSTNGNGNTLIYDKTGDTITLTANPASGYQLKDFTITLNPEDYGFNSGVQYNGKSLKFNMPNNSDIDVVGNFAQYIDSAVINIDIPNAGDTELACPTATNDKIYVDPDDYYVYDVDKLISDDIWDPPSEFVEGGHYMVEFCVYFKDDYVDDYVFKYNNNDNFVSYNNYSRDGFSFDVDLTINGTSIPIFANGYEAWNEAYYTIGKSGFYGNESSWSGSYLWVEYQFTVSAGKPVFNNQEFNIKDNYTGTLEFVVDKSYNTDDGSDVTVKVDNVVVDPSNYDLAKASTHVTLHNDFLRPLSIGEHNLTISIDGYDDATQKFTISSSTPSPTPTPDQTPRYKVPNTGVEGTSNNHSLLKLSSLSLLAIGTYMVIKKKKDN